MQVCIAQKRGCRGAKEFRRPVEKYVTVCLSLQLYNDDVRIGRVVIQQNAVK